MQTYYEILHLKNDAKPEQIKKAFRNLAKIYHPDVECGDSEAFRQINEAYEILSNPISRREYDAKLQQKAEEVIMPAYDNIDIEEMVRTYYEQILQEEAEKQTTQQPVKRKRTLFEKLDLAVNIIVKGFFLFVILLFIYGFLTGKL